ncbi:MAG: hypothetical protein JSW48_01755 [Betaproteobacteria bacterium]|nr:MAG: hypothetical protein JSW48_01755 [Betaproteobacteria bacterium]
MSNEPLPERTNFTGKRQYEDYVDEVIALAKHELRVFEQQLGIGYNASARHDAFRHFLLASRRNKIRIVVHDSATLERSCPRMKQLLRAFNHAITIHETQQQAKGVYDPFVLADESHSVRRFHFDDLRGLFARNDPIEAATLAERFEEIWEMSTPAVTVNTLGL